MLLLERSYRFSAAHLYRRPEWSDQENRERFGKCSIPPGHGHNYRLTVLLRGAVNETTGFLVDLAQLDAAVEKSVIEPLDHRHLNDALAEFAPGASVPTSENLALWIRDALVAALPTGCSLHELRLAEDDDLAAIWREDV